MRIHIKEKIVTIYDDTGDSITMTTEQLLEMVSTINAGTNQDGFLLFTLLELTF